MTAHKNAYAYTSRFFKDLPGKDVRLFNRVYDMEFGQTMSFTDRSGYISTPIRTAIHPQTAMPKFDPTFRMTYEECCHLRVKELVSASEKTGVPIRLRYSGGIDSSLVLISFIKELGQAAAEKILEISMTATSIEENHWLWDKTLRRGNWKILDSQNIDRDWGRDRLMIGGDLNDALFGNCFYNRQVTWMGNDIFEIPWTAELIYNYLRFVELDHDDAESWTKIWVGHISNCPCPIETLADWGWWVEFSTQWCWPYFIPMLFARNNTELNADYFATYHPLFFVTDYFQQWSMNKLEPKHLNTIETYKWLPRKLVADFMGVDEYNRKMKRGSLVKLLYCRKTAALIDDSYVWHDTIDPGEWYNPDNIFGRA
jgi:hypothetical protein